MIPLCYRIPCSIWGDGIKGTGEGFMKKHVFVYGIKLCIVVGLFVMIFHPETFGFAGLFGDVAPLDVWNALREASTTGTAA